VNTQSLAESLDGAQVDRRALTALPGLDDLDISTAYDVQRAAFDRRLERGEQASGVKLGFTSKAKMEQMGVDELIVGRLSGAMCVDDGGTLDLSTLIHPRIEPEIAFRLSRDVDPRDPLDDLRTAVDAVAPALEIIDSRFEGFAFSLPGVIADNTSAAAYAIGQWRPFGIDSDLDIGNLAVTLTINGARAEVGSSSAILGHPLRTLPQLKAMAVKHGFELRSGFFVLAGAATAAVPLEPGVVEARVAGLGRVSIEARA